eukprot:749057-Hanusia_phi.AAC.1
MAQTDPSHTLRPHEQTRQPPCLDLTPLMRKARPNSLSKTTTFKSCAFATTSARIHSYGVLRHGEEQETFEITSQSVLPDSISSRPGMQASTKAELGKTLYLEEVAVDVAERQVSDQLVRLLFRHALLHEISSR